MQKPTTIIRQELIEKIAEAINTSGLPFFIIEPILKDLLDAVHQGAEAQFEKDRVAYQEYLEKETKAQEAQTAEDNAISSETEG